MAKLLAPIRETAQEVERRKREASVRRTKVLSVVAVVAIGARLLIKNPPPQKIADVSRARIKIIPGMLDAMPPSERAKLDPRLVAQMMAVDEAARTQTAVASAPAKPSEPYHPAGAPSLKEHEDDVVMQRMYAYEIRHQIDEKRKEMDDTQVDTRKSTLVLFTSGGYVKTEKAAADDDGVEIRLDKTIQAEVPSGMVSAIQKDALNWEEPVPDDQVRLRPAKGITVILNRETAGQITIDKPPAHEI
ncbi:MAG: hypothetical protein JO102_05535 [Elusimicrobia bacterium]|nr:hypothetical protein [Elusimicrobiota bacterium]